VRHKRTDGQADEQLAALLNAPQFMCHVIQANNNMIFYGVDMFFFICREILLDFNQFLAIMSTLATFI